MKNRIVSFVLIITFLPFCWLAMQAVHETGHVIGALMHDVSVEYVLLGPLTISQTITGETEHKRIITWLGPVFGVIFPVALWLMARLFQWPELFLFRFFAGFCLVANGVYLLFGPVDGLTDTGVLLSYGASRWQLILFGVIATVAGFLLWHGQSNDFGIGKQPKAVQYRTVLISSTLLLLIIFVEIVFFRPTL
ncbi:MAG: hypothetical protein FWC50_10805 [Planctomycetaceae bacterium]|nr:hypothetical protein [Planctomycetaceae bacterium]